MRRSQNDSWNTGEEEFAAARNIEDKLRVLLRYAVLAPSIHNSQPWMFSVDNNEIRLHIDRSRTMPIVDPRDRALIIGCGAALFNLRIAMRYFGLKDESVLMPDPGLRDLLATIRAEGQWSPTVEEQTLFSAITIKRTGGNEKFDGRPIEDDIADGLRRAAELEGVWIALIQDKASSSKVADLVAEANIVQERNKHFRRELSTWVRRKTGRKRDGITGEALGLNAAYSYIAPLVVRYINIGKSIAEKDRRRWLSASLAVMIGTNADDSENWLQAGQAMERMLLYAAANGIHMAYMNQPIEVSTLRLQLRDIVGKNGFPQQLLCMGFTSS